MASEVLSTDGGPAFPISSPSGSPQYMPMRDGISVRDYFAAQAINGFLSQSHLGPDDWTKIGFGWGEDCANDLNKHSSVVASTLATFAYKVADEMLKAREAKNV